MKITIVVLVTQRNRGKKGLKVKKRGWGQILASNIDPPIISTIPEYAMYLMPLILYRFCFLVSLPCEDRKERNCRIWSSKGFCDKYEDIKYVSCKKTCGVCTGDLSIFLVTGTKRNDFAHYRWWKKFSTE